MQGTVRYYNGRKFRIRNSTRRDLFGRYRVYFTFAYRGVPAEWPAVVNCTMR